MKVIRLVCVLLAVLPVLYWPKRNNEMNDQILQSVIKFLMRRGLTLIGGGAAELTDNQIAQFVGISFVIGNELYQAWKAHQADKAKGDTVSIPR